MPIESWLLKKVLRKNGHVMRCITHIFLTKTSKEGGQAIANVLVETRRGVQGSFS